MSNYSPNNNDDGVDEKDDFYPEYGTANYDNEDIYDDEEPQADYDYESSDMIESGLGFKERYGESARVGAPTNALIEAANATELGDQRAQQYDKVYKDTQKLRLSPAERFYILVNKYYTDFTINSKINIILNVSDIRDNITKLKWINNYNPALFVLGLKIIDNNYSISKDRIEYITANDFKKITENILIADVIRYARLWLNLLQK